MIDIRGRRRLAAGLHRLAAGRITNEEFETTYAAGALRSEDAAVRHVYEAAWTTYSDLENHRLTGRYRLNRAARRDLARCILFLRSARAYEWPAPSRCVELAWLPVHLATLGMSSRILRKRWQRSGEFSVWPFRRWSDYRAALRQPVYLNGPRP